MMKESNVDFLFAREEALKSFSQINWNSFTRSASSSSGLFLSKDQIALFEETETLFRSKKNNQTEALFLEGHGALLAEALLKLLQNVTEPTVVKYALARTQELLPDGMVFQKHVKYFISKESPLELGCFLRLIQDSDVYIQHAAAHLLALFLTVKGTESDINALIDWIINVFHQQQNNPTKAAINSLMVLLRSEKARVLFTKAHGLEQLAGILQNSGGRAQLSYEICFCLWTLSLCGTAIKEFGSSGALNALVQQVVAAPREKVVRVALGALKNLLGEMDGVYNERMIDAGLIKTISNLKDRKWTDEEIVQDLDKIRTVLLRDFKELTTMGRYEKELRTGSLDWGLLHTDKFWRENCMDFEAKDFELIRMLIELLECDDPRTLSVCLYDLGDFVRYYPNGKHIVKRLGGKKLMINLMNHDDADVQKQALQCVSKMMVNQWEYVK